MLGLTREDEAQGAVGEVLPECLAGNLDRVQVELHGGLVKRRLGNLFADRRFADQLHRGHLGEVRLVCGANHERLLHQEHWLALLEDPGGDHVSAFDGRSPGQRKIRSALRVYTHVHLLEDVQGLLRKPPRTDLDGQLSGRDGRHLDIDRDRLAYLDLEGRKLPLVHGTSPEFPVEITDLHLADHPVLHAGEFLEALEAGHREVRRPRLAGLEHLRAVGPLERGMGRLRAPALDHVGDLPLEAPSKAEAFLVNATQPGIRHRAAQSRERVGPGLEVHGDARALDVGHVRAPDYPRGVLLYPLPERDRLVFVCAVEGRVLSEDGVHALLQRQHHREAHLVVFGTRDHLRHLQRQLDGRLLRRVLDDLYFSGHPLARPLPVWELKDIPMEKAFALFPEDVRSRRFVEERLPEATRCEGEMDEFVPDDHEVRRLGLFCFLDPGGALGRQ